MYNIPRDLTDALRSGPVILEKLLEGVTQEQAAAAKGGSDGWSVVEIVCHLRDAEYRAAERVQAMRDQDNPFLPAFDPREVAREANYDAQDLRQALQDFVDYRKAHIVELETLQADQWVRAGLHEEEGMINIQSHTMHMVSRDCQYAARIARQLG